MTDTAKTAFVIVIVFCVLVLAATLAISRQKANADANKPRTHAEECAHVKSSLAKGILMLNRDQAWVDRNCR